MDNGEVRVRAPKTSGYRTKAVKPGTDAGKRVVIVGGGPAAQNCAETLRNRTDHPWDGQIVVLTDEDHAPYDRTILSKQLTKTPADLALRKPELYQQAGIDLQTGSKVVSVDASNNTVKTAQGSSYKYDYLVLASGGRPRTLSIPGSDAKNVFVLRSPKDANQIAAQSANKKVVVIGSSFIGMEVAAFMADKAASCTVVGNTAVPFSNVLGDEVGMFFKNLHDTKGEIFF